jgi:hypothetical protein
MPEFFFALLVTTITLRCGESFCLAEVGIFFDVSMVLLTVVFT